MSDAQKEGGVFTVVLNYNRYALTRDMLESLRNTRGGKSRVRLVENHSTDGSAEKLRREFPEVEILEPGENMGRAGGRNYGARAAIEGAPIIYFFATMTPTSARIASPGRAPAWSATPRRGSLAPG